MKAKIGVASLLISVFSAGIAGLTISQSHVPSAQAASARVASAHDMTWHESPADKAYFDSMAFEGADPQICLIDSSRPPFADHGAWENLSPEQRSQMMRKFMEDRLRDNLSKAGYTDDDLQDAVVNFSRAMESDRSAIREKCGRVRGAMADGSTDTQIAYYMNDLRRSVAAAKSHRDQGRKTLNNKISFTKKPRLDAILSMWGLGGDESSYFMSSFGGRDFRRRSFNNSKQQ